LSPQRLVRCSCNLFCGSMRRTTRWYLIGVHKAEDPVPSNSDYVHVVSNRWRHKNCSRSHAIPPLRASSTPLLMAQQFRIGHGVLCSVLWKHSSRTLSTTASVPESPRAAGRRRTHISKYVAYSWLCVGSNDRRLIRRSSPAHCCRMQRVWQVRPMHGSSREDWHCRCSSVNRTSGAASTQHRPRAAVLIPQRHRPTRIG
jgi:hypothetical protein